MPTPFQPGLTLEIPLTEAEQNFIDETPPNLFPENQDSNWGLFRKLFSDEIQLAIEQQNSIYNERFIDSSSDFVDEWEEQMGLPVSPTGFDISTRRAIVHSRLLKGAFTRERIAALIEQFIVGSLGNPTQLVPLGIPFGSNGITLYGEVVLDLKTVYRVYEDQENFTYTVWVKNGITVLQPELIRELLHFTPSGITLVTNFTLANILDYDRTVITDGPSGYWKLSSLTDATTLAHNLTNNNLVGSGAALALNTSSAASSTFNGTNQWLSTTYTGDPLNARANWAVEFWFKPTSAITGAKRVLANREKWEIYINTNGNICFDVTVNGILNTLFTSFKVVTNGVYHLYAEMRGPVVQVYVNGVSVGTLTFPDNALMDATTQPLEFGRGTGATNYFTGSMDEIAYYSHPLIPGRVLAHYKTGINVP